MSLGQKGLSPYTRGNHGRIPLATDPTGSIPVHTGKPPPADQNNHQGKVYPRTHGETWC